MSIADRIRKILKDEDPADVEYYIDEIGSYSANEAFSLDATDEEIYYDYVEFIDARC